MEAKVTREWWRSHARKRRPRRARKLERPSRSSAMSTAKTRLAIRVAERVASSALAAGDMLRHHVRLTRPNFPSCGRQHERPVTPNDDRVLLVCGERASAGTDPPALAHPRAPAPPAG